MKLTARQIIAEASDRFRPEKATGLEAVFHFIITGAEEFELNIAIHHAECHVSNSKNEPIDCTVKIDAETYIGIETGQLNPQTEFLSGKIEVSNPALLLRFMKCFKRVEMLTPAETGVENKKSSWREKRKGPFAGIRIADFTRLLPGPMASMLLADIGADVIKIEDSNSPDYLRYFEPTIHHNSVYYYALNRNKRSLSADLYSSQGKEIIKSLIKTSDVVLEQFRPNVMQAMGLGYEEMSAVNPKLIYISITGYGQRSGLSAMAGHDLNYIARAGVLGLNTDAFNAVTIPGFQLADIAGGAYMVMNAVATALYQREKTGQGQFIDLAMTDCSLPFIALPFAGKQADAVGQSGKYMLSGALANYNVYKCLDGKYIALAALEPKFWSVVCEVLDRKDWLGLIGADAARHLLVKEELEGIFSKKCCAEWLDIFRNSDACISPVNNITEVAEDQYLKEKGLFIDFTIGDMTLRTIANPIKFAATEGSENWQAPTLGEHSYEILTELLYSEKEIKEFIKYKSVKCS